MAPVVRRVRLELPLPADLESPAKEELQVCPYDRWLRNHVQEVMSLTDQNGNQLLQGIRSVNGQTASADVYVTDFCFGSTESFEYYKSTYQAAMRARIGETYPSALQANSSFKYKIAVSTGTRPH
jgi:hypothetical protein